ncbi:MAG: DUF4245 domain-containing protein [Actinomycetota bacterium]
MTLGPDTTPAPAMEPAARRGMGTLRGMVISMVLIIAAVLAWIALVPRVSGISQPAVDVSAVAMQVRQDTSWTISEPQLPAGWKATSVRFAPAADGLRTWHVGYLSPEGNYVSLEQTRGATDLWVSAQTSAGKGQGSVSAAGRTWQKLSSGTTVQRSLVSRGSGPGDLTTVLSGTAPYAQLAQVAATLQPVPAG